LSDAGPDSNESNKLVFKYGIIPVIAARENNITGFLENCMTSGQLSSGRVQMK
jgi:hypothetical protein